MNAHSLLRRLQPFGESNRLNGIVKHAIHAGKTLANVSDSELRNRASDLRAKGKPKSVESLANAIALVFNAVHREKGFEPYPEQIFAACAVASQNIIEMKTGEGKSIVAVMASYLLSIEGNGVHLATTNDYLAERDAESASAILGRIGIDVGAILSNDNPNENRTSYDKDVTVGPGYQFGFDYLKDQASLRTENTDTLGHQIVRCLSGRQSPQIVQSRSPRYAVIDEADSVLIDEAMTPMILSAGDGKHPDIRAFASAAKTSDCLVESVDFYIQNNRAQLTSAGRERISKVASDSNYFPMERPWLHYIENALAAKWLYQRDEHYVVVDDEVRIVDQLTGRIFKDRSWQNGLHQSIEFKENVPLTAGRKVLARVTRQRFFQRYDMVAGMTGTIHNLGQELFRTYRSKTISIPSHRPNQRRDLAPRFFADWEAKLRAISSEVREYHTTGRPVLIGTRTIRESQRVAEALARENIDCNVLNGLQDRAEAEVIACAGRSYAVTVATNMAGRGTDIELTVQSRIAGGLHVIATEAHESSRIDAQLFGRAGRQGDPGSSRFFLSCEDSLLEHCSERWKQKLIQSCDSNGNCRMNLLGIARKVQTELEWRQRAQREDLLLQDRWLDSVKEEYEAIR